MSRQDPDRMFQPIYNHFGPHALTETLLTWSKLPDPSEAISELYPNPAMAAWVRDKVLLISGSQPWGYQ